MARRKKIVHAVQEIIPAEIKPAKCVNEERTNTIKASIAFDITRDLYERDIFGTKNEILLGINPCIYGLNYHDPSVVVFINGEVVFGIEEERCNRIKGSKGMFPSSAIKQSLIHCNLTWDDIDAIVIGYDPALWMDRLNLEILDIIQKCKNDILKQA